MRLKILLFFLILLPMNFSLQASLWDTVVGKFKANNRPTAPTIRVLLVHDVESAKLDVNGKYSLYDPYTNSYISSRFTGKSRLVQAVSHGLKWGEEFPGLYQIKIKPDNASTTTYVDGREYLGPIFVYDIGGTISIVNQTPVEDYVLSVLAAYDAMNLEPELLSALAITARTYAYFQAANPNNTYWAVDAQKVGFQGIIPIPKSIQTAVNNTRYMLLSQTGMYEGMSTPFAAKFETGVANQTSKETVLSKISLEEANEMAKRGEHAAQILSKAFPGTTILLMQYVN